MGDGDYLMALELQREFEREMELPEDVSYLLISSVLILTAYIRRSKWKRRMNQTRNGSIVKRMQTWIARRTLSILRGKPWTQRQMFTPCSAPSTISSSRVDWSASLWSGANGCIPAQEFAILAEIDSGWLLRSGWVSRCLNWGRGRISLRRFWYVASRTWLEVALAIATYFLAAWDDPRLLLGTGY